MEGFSRCRTSFGAPDSHPISGGSMSCYRSVTVYPFTIGASSSPVPVSTSWGFPSSTRSARRYWAVWDGMPSTSSTTSFPPSRKNTEFVARIPSASDRPLEVGEIVIQHSFDLARNRPAKWREQTRRKSSRVEVELHRDSGAVAGRLEPERRVDSHTRFMVGDGVHAISFECRD